MKKYVLTAQDMWDDLHAVRTTAPLVHSITNFVVTNYNANALLALGASPVMAHAHEEVADMVGIAQAVVLNIGTLAPYWLTAMKLALTAAVSQRTPVVLDPVGAGATAYRNQSLNELLAIASPTVIRGNASEVMSLAGLASSTRGVESSTSSDEAVAAAKSLALALGCVVCVSGADDHIVDSKGRWLTLSNGHPWMTKVTGVGCSASAIVGAFVAVQSDIWRATAAAMAYLGVVGEYAAERVIKAHRGVGTLQYELLDGLQLLSQDEFLSRLKFVVRD